MSTTAVRLDDDQIRSLDTLAARLSELAHGAPVSRSHVLRQVITKGITIYEKELDVGDAKRAKS